MGGEVGALDVGALDVGALDVGALDVGALDVGALEVGALDVGALDVGRDVWRVGRGVYVGSGAWSVCLAGTLAAGGNFSIGSPSRSSFITAAQVAVG